jgi:O-antigen ligase
MCLPFCAHRKGIIGYGALVLSCVIIALTRSSVGLFSAFISCIVYTFFTNKKLFIALIVSSVIAGFLFTQKYDVKTYLNPTGRIEVHREAWKILREKPLTGMGLGTFEHLIGGNAEIYKKCNNQNWKELHDEYGQIWFSTGLIGLILFLGFIGSSIKSFLMNRTVEKVVLFSSLSAFLIICAGHFPLRISPLSFYAVILTGLFLKTGE